MASYDSPASLADISGAGVALSPAEAASIVRELLLRASRGELPGIPSPAVVRLHATGEISVEGPIAADDRAVLRAGDLIEGLLPPFDAPAECRVPGALRLVVARALGSIDLPPYPSVEEFAAALERFSSADLSGAVRAVVARYGPAAAALQEVREREARDRASEPAEVAASAAAAGQAAGEAPGELEPVEGELTISDIRRARRATGMTLSQISERCRISPRLLVELEWGYLRNWPVSHVGRTQLVRYARAAGLDDRIVVRTVWPLLEASALERGGAQPPDIDMELVPERVPERVQAPPPALPAAVLPAAGGRAPRRGRYLAALAIPALLAIGVAPALWERTHRTPPASSAATARAADPAPRPSLVEAPRPSPVERRQAASTGAAGVSRAEELPDAARRTAKVPDAARTRPDVALAAGAPAAPLGGIAEGPAYSPSFDSVGTAVFYQAESGGRSALMRADTDSRGAILRITSVVDDRARNFHARPSPDGRRLAFDSDRDGERGVYVADADGGGVRRISGEGFAAIPSWSPDGRTIAFVRAEPSRPKVWNLWTTDLETGRTRRLTSHRVGAPWGGSWFPDGRRLAYSHETRLVLLDIDSGQQRVYPSPIRGRLLRTPAVSPDGRRVMFQVHRDGAWILELSDGSMRKVLADPSAEEYTWAPDGRRVAYHSRRTGTWGVWIMAAR